MNSASAMHLPARFLTLLAVLALVLASAGCGPATSESKQTLQLKVGLLPIVDVLPIYVADSEGYFTAQNLQVELVLFPSALERDSALMAGQIDGELNDLVSASLINKEGDTARVVRLAYRGNPTQPMMLVLVAPGSPIQSAAELKGVPVAISGNSVIEFSTDKLLELAGLRDADIVKTEVTKIPVRAEMLAKGQVQAATLPQPLAALAIQQGARVVADDGESGIGQSVLTFRKQVVDKNPEAIRRFLVAYEKAVGDLNASPDKYRDLLVDKAKVPDSLKATFRVPPYPTAQVPTQEDLAAVMIWAVKKGLLTKAIAYDRMVVSNLLPK